MLAVFAPLDESGPAATRGLSTWSSPTRTLRGSACSPGRPPRSTEQAALRGPTNFDPSRSRVSAAFHSRLVADAVEAVPTVPELDRHPAPSPIPVFSNRTAEPYPDDAGRPAPCWPVSSPGRSNSSPRSKQCTGWGPDLRRSRSRLQADGAGSRDPRGTRPSRNRLDASRGPGNVDDLACSLASLAAHGYAVDLSRLGRRELQVGAPRNGRASP